MTSMDNIWIANLVTSVGVGGILIYFFKRYVNQQDDRNKALDQKVADCDERSDLIEKNYIKRFDDVNKEINQSNNRLGEKISEEIKELTKSINESEKESIKEMAKMSGRVENMQNDFNQIKRVLK